MATVDVEHDTAEGPPQADSTRTVPKSATQLVLDFVSNASNETLIACAVGICAVSYMVFGRFALLLIGVAAGIALHATWERHNGDPAEPDKESRRRKEAGIDVARRLLDWKDSRSKSDTSLDAKTEVALKVAARQELDFSDYPPETASALSQLTDAVIKDYVKFWYNPVLPGEATFPFAARQTFTGFMLAFCNHQARKRPADALLNFITNATSIFIVFLGELSKALMAPDAIDLEAAEALHLYLDRSLDSSLSNIANREEQERKLLAVADDFLQSFLDPKTYNCEPAKLFLRHVFAGIILQSVLNTISQPDWINGWIVYLLEEGEPELITAIDAGVEKAADKVQTQPHVEQSILPGADSLKTSETAQEDDARKKRLSDSGDAMQAAMDEAKRLTEMIQASEEAKVAPADDASSTFTTNSQVTPSSSQDELRGDSNINTQDPSSVHPGSDKSNIIDPAALIAEQEAQARSDPPAQFTSFDQITPAYRPIPEVKPAPPLTLHNATITLYDDALPGDKSVMKSKPQLEYLLQIEPSSALHSGWMVPRKYSELGPLHEYLYKIANVSGAPGFARRYQDLPHYKGKTKDAYRQELEKYLRDVVTYEPLAESEGMKRFLDKDQGFAKSGGNKNPLAFAAPVGDAFQTVGKGMLGGFSTATKGITTGGQAVFEGVGGLFGGPKKTPTSPKPPQRPESLQVGQSSIGDVPRASREFASSPRPSFESRSSDAIGIGISGTAPSSPRNEEAPPQLPPRQVVKEDLEIKLPPPPSQLDEDDTDSAALPTPPASIRDSIASLTANENATTPTDRQPTEPAMSPINASLPTPTIEPLANEDDESLDHAKNSTSQKKHTPLDEQETRVAIELMFAAINELYTLSSAWNIRRTLLNAAKNYLLRPGNPSLIAIQDLLQSSILDANTSDEAIAAHIRKMRQNGLPTQAELATWPPPATEDEKEKLRTKARKLLVSRGMPQALTSVMGAAASGEALGRVFDALQVERVSRAFMFAMLLQGIRAVTS